MASSHESKRTYSNTFAGQREQVVAGKNDEHRRAREKLERRAMRARRLDRHVVPDAFLRGHPEHWYRGLRLRSARGCPMPNCDG